MLRYFLQSIQREFKSSPKLLITFAAIAGVGIITLGVVIISMMWTPSPPDAEKEDFKTIAKFMKTQRYNGLPASQQRRYMRAVASRMDKLDSKQRKDAYRLFSEVRKENPQAAKSLHVGMAVHKLSALHGKTPEQERAKIKATLAVMEAVRGKRGMRREYQRTFGETPEERRKSIERTLKGLPDAYKATSIDERRNILRTTINIKKELDARYGN